MRRNPLLLLAVGALVVMAGCSGALTGTDGPATDSPDSDEPTAADVTYPDAVSENGTDVAALADAHADALNGSSFSLALELTQNSSMGNQSVDLTAAVSPDRDNVRANVSAAGRQTDLYLTADKRFQKQVVDGETAYRVTNRTSDGARMVPSSYSGAAYVEQYAAATNASFAPDGVREVDGETLVVLRADGSNVSVPADGVNVTAYDATMLVDERGLIHSFEVALDTEQGDASANISLSMDVTDVNETTVEEPSWLDEARNQSSA